jgi:hypothetical protein
MALSHFGGNTVLLQPAASLNDAYQTLSPEPLIAPDVFQAFYRGDVNAVRGGDKNGKINQGDANEAIKDLRTQYGRSLGESPHDAVPVKYEDKAERLVKIYKSDPIAQVPDPILHSLLRARAVQEFNGERWFGVHPLVVDILRIQGKLRALKGKPLPGGTY